MKKFNIKKASSDRLCGKLNKINHLENGDMKYYKIAQNFSGLACEIEKELDRRNRAAIYRVACRVLKNRHFGNQFTAAACYADAVINGSDYFSTDDSHEIDSFYTKSGNPVIVDF